MPEYLFNPKVKRFLHGGDWNPDQWLANPEIIDEDFRLMPLAHCNAFSVGIFSWVALEPEEGKYNFTWLENILDRLAKDGHQAILATPSGARPAWMGEKYPEIYRTNSLQQKHHFGERHNHCPTSPIYREKVLLMNTELVKRFGKHPAVILWHLSNEYGGECHCDLCQKAFRLWLQNKYNHDLKALNQKWWTAFWSHTYTAWEQISSPSKLGESGTHALVLDWKRFVTDQTIEFIRNESKPLRELSPQLPITTNLMNFYPGLDYFKLAKELDVATWDNYPEWHHDKGNHAIAQHSGMAHDLFRSLKQGKPFLLMESSPSATNWQQVGKLRRPGMHELASLQAVAHGSDSVLYFQWRKSRGSSEKLHGAVVDHVGHEHTRVFKEVAKLGSRLEKLSDILGATTKAEVAIVFDWEVRWALEEIQGPRNDHQKKYLEEVRAHYTAFWNRGIACDLIDQTQEVQAYQLVVAPMAYLLRPGFAEKIDAHVKNGGHFVATYLTGIANENDLCFLGGWPGPLREVLGIWAEELDCPYSGETNDIVFDKPYGQCQGKYPAHTFCDLIHAESAEVLATYSSDFYAGRPTVTRNKFGKGKAWYLATRTNESFLADFYETLTQELSLSTLTPSKLPEGVSLMWRENDHGKFIFVMNFSDGKRTCELHPGKYEIVETKQAQGSSVQLNPYEVLILKQR